MIILLPWGSVSTLKVDTFSIIKRTTVKKNAHQNYLFFLLRNRKFIIW